MKNKSLVLSDTLEVLRGDVYHRDLIHGLFRHNALVKIAANDCARPHRLENRSAEW